MEKQANGDSQPQQAQEADLPTYANVQAQTQRSREASTLATEHHTFLEGGKGRKWLNLFVKSRSPESASLPVFVEGDVISGRVEVDLDKAESSKAVTVAILAGTTFVGQDEELFLKQEKTLWEGSKLSGKRSWPFSFDLPREVTIKEPDTQKEASYCLPPHFSERASPAYIDYRIVVKVKRGFLKVDQKLVTKFAYQPVTIAGQPSALRRLVYSEHSALLGPEGDPEGWKVLPPLAMKGKIFNTEEVELTCTLAVASPLSYAVGSPIPLIMTIVGEDTKALDVLTTSREGINLRLRRSMATGSDATNDSGVRRSDNHFVEECGGAVFWIVEGGPKKRVLHGELDISKTLKPSFKFPRFTIRYFLELLPFTAVGFTHTSPSNNVLLKEEVTIATRQAAGSMTRSYAPPGYEKPNVVDYNKSLGLLENGNQRFLGHHHGSGR
ncbi:hypothetical protein D9613_007827 [Agrocybe pediades]|uniref:Arrestin-like N-terminal domain-containing protein n=1 Tax=Agrocybe pediades TaxID=84607 RepID=A0A8H4QNL9_9AGAR|nr:hypothetical protein D9613_007827 [Agrocybe pediades]